MLAEPGPIAKRAAEEALQNVGVTEEGGNNRGRFVEIYQKATGNNPGDAWCASFVRFRFENAAKDLGLTLPSHFPDSGWTPDYKTWANSKGVWIPVQGAEDDPTRVKPGDLALFYFSAKQRIAHIGIVVEVHEWGCYVVEGNTGPDSGEVVNRDGDGVYRKKRNWSEMGQFGGYARCAF